MDEHNKLARHRSEGETPMSERDDAGLAGVLRLALLNSSSLTLGLMALLVKKGVMTTDDLSAISGDMATSIEQSLGSAHGDETEVGKALREYAANLKRMSQLAGPAPGP